MDFVFDDGGREKAGFKGSTGDCAVRSIAIVTGKNYLEVYDAINHLALRERKGKRKRGISNARTGVYRATVDRYMKSLGYQWIPTMFVGQGCKVHLRDGELPSTAKLLVCVSRHYTAVINNTIHDNHNPARNGNRCVYGYYIKAG